MQRKFTDDEINQLLFLASELKDSIANRRGWQNFDMSIESQLEQIAAYLFPICSACGQRHPQIVLSEAEEEKMKIISAFIGDRLTSH